MPKELSPNTQLSIHEAANFLGVSSKTLRRWENASKLIPLRTEGGHRRYTLAQIKAFKSAEKKPVIKAKLYKKPSSLNVVTPMSVVTSIKPEKPSPTVFQTGLAEISTETPRPQLPLVKKIEPDSTEIYHRLHIDQRRALNLMRNTFIATVFVAALVRTGTITKILDANKDTISRIGHLSSNDVAISSGVAEKIKGRVLADQDSIQSTTFVVNVESSFRQPATFEQVIIAQTDLNLAGNSVTSSGDILINPGGGGISIGDATATIDLEDGDLFISDELEVASNISAGSYSLGADTITDFTGDGITVVNGALTASSPFGTSIDSSEITDGTIAEADLNVTNTPSDNQILSYDASTGTFTWVSDQAGSGSLFTDGGSITYLTSTTDDLALGGSTSSAPFFFDTSAGSLAITGTLTGDTLTDGTASITGGTGSGFTSLAVDNLTFNGTVVSSSGDLELDSSSGSLILTGFDCTGNSNGGKLTVNASGVVECADDDSGAGSSPWQVTAGVVNLVTGTNNVTIGSSTNLAKLGVEGDTDEVQLLVRGNATQTSNLVVFENSAGTDQFVVTNTGNLTLTGDATITGGDIITGASAASIFNSNATSLDIGEAATTVSLGAGSGTTTINNALISTGAFTASGTATITSTLTANGVANIGDGGDTIALSGTTVGITSNSAGNDITLTTADDLILDDAQLTSPIQLTDADTSLPNSNIGIVDAINDAYNAAIAASNSGWTDGGSTVALTTAGDEVAIGGGGAPLSSAKVSIDGDADQIQLIVQGNATQTLNLAVFEQSDGTDIVTLDNSGNLLIEGSIGDLTGGTLTVADALAVSGALSVTGVISDSDSNLILDDTVDIGSATTGIRITTAGAISDIDGNITLSNNTDINGNLDVSGTLAAGTTNAFQVDATGNITTTGTTGITLSGADADATFSGTGTHTLSASGGTLQLGAVTLGGAVTGNAQTITGLAQLTVDNVRVDGNTIDTTSGGLTLDSTSGTTTVSDNLSVTGTINGLTVSGGTITTGVWNGTVIGEIYGGTGQNAVTTGDLLYGAASNDWDRLPIGTAGQVLSVSGGVPSWTTVTGGLCPTCVITNPTSTQTITNPAAVTFAIDSDATNSTLSSLTGGAFDVTVGSTTGNNVGFTLDYTSDSGVTSGNDLFGSRITLTQNDLDGDLFGVVITNANTTAGAAASTDDLIFLNNADTDSADGGTVDNALRIGSAGATITTAIDASDTEIVTALNVGANDIIGTTGIINFTNFDLDASGNLTAGTYNGQTISSAANFTGTVAVTTSVTSPIYTGTGAVSLSSAGGGALTLDSSSGTVAIASGDALQVPSGSINSNNAAITIDSGSSNQVNIGSSDALSNGTWTIDGAGAITGVTTITASGSISAATAETINGIDISAGTVTDVVNLTINSGGDLTIGSIGLNDPGAGSSTSGANLIGVFEGTLTNSSSSILQQVLEDLDSAIGGGASKWTNSGTLTYLTETGDDLAVGGTDSTAEFYIDIQNGGNVAVTSSGDTENLLSVAGNSLTTGTGLALSSTATAFNGELLTLSKTGASGSTAFTSDIANVTYSQTFNGGVGLDSTGNVLDISRAITLNNNGQTHTISGAVARIIDSGTQTDGTLAHTGNVLFVDQNYASSTGDVLSLENAGTGDGIQLTSSSTGNLINLIASGSGTTPAGITIANNSTGAITTAIDLSDAEIATALAVGSNDVTVGGATISSTEFAILDNNISLTSEVTGILPVANGGTGVDATTVTDGQLLIGNDAGNGFTLAALVQGNGMTITNGAGSISLAVDATTTGTTAVTSANSGIESTSTGIRLLGGCTGDQILKWNSGTSVWECATDQGSGSGSSKWTESGGLLYPNNFSTVDFALGASSLTAPFSVDISANLVRIGDGADDANTPTINFFASDATDSGSLVYNDDDQFQFSGGDVLIDQTLTLSTGAGAGISGGGLTDCDGTTQKLVWDVTTNEFGCGTDSGSGSGGSKWTTGSSTTYLTDTASNLTVGAGDTLTSPLSFTTASNLLRIGDGTDDTNDPTITLYASDGADSGSLSYLDTDRFSFSGGDVAVNQNLMLPTLSQTATGSRVDLTSTFDSTASSQTLTGISLDITNNPTTNANTARGLYMTVGDAGSLANTVYGGYIDATTANANDTVYGLAVQGDTADIHLLGGTISSNNIAIVLDSGSANSITLGSSDALNISGNFAQTGATTLSTGTGAVSINGNTTFASGTTITQAGSGQVSFGGNIDATNGLDVTTANFTVGGANFSVAPASGNTTIAGTLGVTGLITASGGVTLPANQNLTLSTGTGTITQTHSNTTGSASTFNVTNSSASGTSTVNGLNVAFTGTATSGTNANNALRIGDITDQSNNTFTALSIGDNYDNLLVFEDSTFTGSLQGTGLSDNRTYTLPDSSGEICLDSNNCTFVSSFTVAGESGSNQTITSGDTLTIAAGTGIDTVASATDIITVSVQNDSLDFAQFEDTLDLDAALTLNQDANTWTQNYSGTGTGLTLAASSTGTPLALTSSSTGNLLALTATGTGTTTTGISIANTSSGTITTAIDVSDAEIATALALGSNDVTVGGATISSSEFALLDGRSGTLVDSVNVGSFATTAVTAGTGLTGGGTTGALTINVSAGTGITVNADDVAIDTSIVPRKNVAETITGGWTFNTAATTFTTGINANGGITTTSGDLTLDSTTGTTNINDNLAVSGTINGLTVSSGTITAGTWNATAIDAIYGGTGQTAVASGDLLYGSASNVWSRLGIGTANQVLTVSGGLPVWSTVTGSLCPTCVITNPTSTQTIVHPAGVAFALDSSTTDSTLSSTTAGAFDVNVDSLTANNVGFTLDYTSVNGVATGDNLYGGRLTVTQNDADGDLFGFEITNGNTTTASASTDDLLLLTNADTDSAANGGTVDNALRVQSSGAVITDALDVSDTEIVNALNIGANEITGTTGTINLSNFDVASTGAITVAASVGIDTNGAGALALGNTTATSITLGRTGITTTNPGALTVTQTLTADGTLDANGIVTLGDNGDAITLSGTTIGITSNSAGNDITLTSADDIIFDDLQLSSPIQLTDADTTLPNANTGIVDAINDAWNAATGTGGVWTDSGTTVYLTNTTDELVLGGTTPLSSAKFSIDGDADQIQFLVQGNATQTTNLLTLEQSDGTDVFTVTNAGNLAIEGQLSDLSGATLIINDDLQVLGDDIIDSGGTTRITLGATNTITGDTLVLSGTTTITASSATTLNCSDCINFDDLSDSLTLDATTTITNGLTSNLNLNLSSSGDFVIQDAGVAYATFGDDSVITFAPANATAADGRIFIDGSSTASTATLGLLDINATTVTDGFEGINIDLNITDDAGVDTVIGQLLNIDNNATTADDTVYGIYIDNEDQGAGSDTDLTTDAQIYLNNSDDSVPVIAGILFNSAAGGYTTAIDSSDADISNAINVGQNFILGDGIRQFSSSSTVWTFEDTAGNDLCTITDGGTTGSLNCTGNITGPSTGTIGYWSRTGTTLSPATAGDDILLPDSDTITFGTGSDLSITHNGTNSIIANGTGDLQINGFATGAVVFNESGADVDFRVEGTGQANALFVNGANGTVGIGTNAPDSTGLHILTGSAGAITTNTSADELAIEASGDGGISILTPATNAGRIYFGDTGAANAGQIIYDHTNLQFSFAVETSLEMSLTTAALSPATAEGNALGSTAGEWEALYLGDDNGIFFGLGQDWSFGYDELTDDRLELTTAANSGFLVSTASTTTDAFGVVANSLTSGSALDVSSTTASATAITDGLLGYFNWDPTTTTTKSGDLVRINIADDGNITNLFNVTDNGSSLFRVSEAQIESAVPHVFSAPGDVSFSYDAIFTNQTASQIESYGPFSIIAGESFESNDLTLQTYNSGDIIFTNGTLGTMATFAGSTGNLTLTGDQTINGGTLTLGTAGQDGQLVIYNDLATDQTITFNPSASQTAADIVYTLPPDDGTADNQVLTTDSNGVLAWESISGAGAVDTTGTPADNQIAFFTDANTLASEADLGWDDTNNLFTIAGLTTATTSTSAAITSASNTLTSGGLFSGALTSSTATASFTGDIGRLSSARTNETPSQTLTDTGNVLDLARTTITNNASSTTNVTGSILNISNNATQTLGTLADSSNLVTVTQDADATGALLYLNANRSGNSNTLLFEQSAGGTDILSLQDDGDLAILGDLTITGGDIVGATRIGDGGTSDYVTFSATGDITFTGTADTITGPSAGTLTLTAGASQALTLTGNAASTWSTTSGNLTLHANSNTANLLLAGGDTLPSSVVDGNDLELRAEDDIFLNPTDDVRLYANGVAVDCSASGNGGALTTDANGIIQCSADDGGGASVGGNDTEIQYNNGGVFGGTSAFTFNDSTLELTVTDDFTFTLADTENIAVSSTVTGTNSADVLALTLTNQSSSGTQRGAVLSNADDAANAITESLLTLDNAETTADTVTDYLLISKATTGADTAADAIDVSDADLFNAINLGQNFVLGDGIRQFSSSTTVWTFEDTAGNDLCTITDGGTTGSFNCTGNITGPTTGTVGYWSRSGTTLTPATTGDDINLPDSDTITLGTGSDLSLTHNGTNSIIDNNTGELEVISASNIRFSSDNDTDDYIFLSTETNVPFIRTAGTSNLSIAPDGGTVNVVGDLTVSGGDITNTAGEEIDLGEATADVITFTTGAASEMALSATALYATTAEGNQLGGTDNEWEALYVGDNNGVFFGLDQDWSMGYDELTDDRLELVTAGTSGLYASTAATTTNAFAFVANSLTSGSVLDISSTTADTTAITDGLLGYFNWDPTTTTTKSGDLFRINIADDGNVTNLFNVTDNGSTLFRVSESQIESALPHSFTAAGDVSIAYDIQFTNQTSSSIKSKAPLIFDIGESFESNSATFALYNSGSLIVDGSTDVNTGTGGVLDLNVNSITTGNIGFNVDYTINDGATTAAELFGGKINLTQNDADSDMIGLEINAADTANAGADDYEALLRINGNDTTANAVTDYILITTAATDTTSDAIDVSDSGIFNAINVGQNFILGDGIRQFSSSSTVWTFEDTAGNDLCTITDGGTTGSISCTGSGTLASTLQDAYNNDTDTGDTTIELSAADDSLVISNANDADLTGSAFMLHLNQAGPTAATSALDVTQASNAADAVNITANSIDTEIGIDLVANGLTTGSGMSIASSGTIASGGELLALSATGITSGRILDISSAANTFATGQLVNITTSSTGVTSGNLLSSSLTGASAFTGSLNLFEFSGAATATGDVMRINIGSSSNVGNLFNVTDNGSSLFRVSEAQIESAIPHSFTSPGDVSIAYDLNFTNQTSSLIESNAPLTIRVGEAPESNSLTLQTYNSGQVLLTMDTVNHVIFSPVASADAAATTSIQEIAFSSPADTTGTNVHNGLNIDAEIGNATGGTNTVNLISTDALTGDASVTLNAINIGALTATGATETAINVGSGWDTVLGGSTAGTNIFNFSNFDVTTAGNITVAANEGLDTNAAGALEIGDTTATTVSIGSTAATTLNLGAGGALTRAINIGTGTGADTISIGTGATTADTINFGNTGPATTFNFDSGAATADVFDIQMNSLTTNYGFDLDANAITSGTIFDISSSSAVITTGASIANGGTQIGSLINASLTGNSAFTGNLGTIDWSPTSSTSATGDLFQINIGTNGTTSGKLFRISDAGTDLFSVSETIITSALPHEFTAAGDASFAYDINLTNQTASLIESNAPLTLSAGEPAESNNLTLQTYNNGAIIANGKFSINSQETLEDSTTPSVGGASHFTEANGANRLITTFDDGTAGQIIVIEATDSDMDFDCAGSTTVNCGSTDIAADAGDVFTWMFNGTNWNLLAYMDDSDNQAAGSGFDVAELFPTTETLIPGDVVSIDDSQPVKVKKAIGTDAQRVIGVVSTQPGLILGEPVDGVTVAPVALVGRVPVKIDPSSETIVNGDLIGASSIAGYGKRVQDGFIIGRALETWTPGTGQESVTVFVNPIYVSPVQLAGTSEGSPATDQMLLGGEVTFDSVATTDLTVSGETVLADTTVAGDLSVGTIQIDGFANSINAIGVLAIQPLALGNIEFQGGLITFDTEGNISVKEITAEKININGDSAGSGTMVLGTKSVYINTTAVTEESLIFVTPNETLSYPLSVTQKDSGVGFWVELPVSLSKTVGFDWFIVDKVSSN